MRFSLGKISLAALAVATIGIVPAGANLLGPWPEAAREVLRYPSQGFEQVALKCKSKGNCKKFKKKNQQHQNKPDQTQDKPKQGKDKPKHGGDKPKGGKPVVHPFKPVYRPGGICIGGKIIAQRCQCNTDEVRVTVRKRVFSCQPPDSRLASASTAPAAAVPINAALPAAEFAPDEILLILPLGNSPQLEQQVAIRYNLDILQRIDLSLLGSRIVRCRISGGRSVPEALVALRGDGQVSAAQPNYYYRRQGAANTPFSSGIQYALEKLQVDAAHALATGRGALVAVVDTGIDTLHPDLVAAVAGSFDATEGAPPADDPHGTAIAGIISAHGAIQGVAPGAKVLDVRVFQADPVGAGSIASTMILLRGLQWANDQGSRIINLSLAGSRDALAGLAIAALVRKNTVVVAAAGNAGASAPSAYPAAFDDVIAVTATDLRDALYASANHGSYIAVAAPGVDVIAPALYEAYQVGSGTSFAAAHVSGVIALMLERGPKLSIQEIRAALQSGAKDLGPPGTDDEFGAGRVNALSVLQNKN